MRQAIGCVVIATFFGLSTGCATAPSRPYSELTWQEKLRYEETEIRSGKYVMDSYFLMGSKGKLNGKQFRLYSEAPASGEISKETFVSISTMLMMLQILPLSYLAQATSEALKAKGHSADFGLRTIDGPIGEVDLELRVIMTAEGFQMSVTGKRGSERLTMTWQEFFAED